MSAAHAPAPAEDGARAVDDSVARARAAQIAYARGADQARLARAALAVGWAIMEPARNAALSALAVESTGLGRIDDKIAKNHRKTLGLLRDLRGARTTGIVREEPSLGLTELLRPVGVVGAIVPSTNPAATPANNAINALACGNAIVLAPSPAGAPVCEALVGFAHAELERAGIDPDLVQMLPAPASKAKTERLLRAVDLVVATGSQDNVRRAYASGTPALGVGAGNATVIVDEAADPVAAARLIAASKTFDNATSCSSENQLIVVQPMRDRLLAALHAEGGRLLDAGNAARLHAALFDGGHLNRRLIAKDIDVLLDGAGLDVDDPGDARFVLLDAGGVGPGHPESGEKLSLVLTLHTVRDFDAALERADRILAYQGAGHSVGLHSGDAVREARALALATRLPTCRVILDQAHCFATGGAFDNGLPFSLSMGCGTWGGNVIDDNLHWRHFVNRTRIVRPIPKREPAIETIFDDYWAHVGR